MSLPTTKPAQPTLQSFFQKYTPPPGSKLPPPTTSTPPPPARSAPTSTSAVSTDVYKPDYIPASADIRIVSEQDIPAVKRINALLLPVSYQDNVYNDAVGSPFCRAITWSQDGEEPKVVGAIICRAEPILPPPASGPDSQGRLPQSLYIRSLCLLSPYRSHGLVNAAIDSIAASALADPSSDFRAISAHVWTENDEGLQWYEKRGFAKQGSAIENYYIKLRPGSAWLVSRPIAANVRSALPGTPTSAPPSATQTPPMKAVQSYQNQRAETEWNDLPEDMMKPGLLNLPKRNGGDLSSNASSRSSSAARKKRDRSYPAAAFGS